MQSMKAISLTSESFDAALSADRPVLVDFHAPWCRPCVLFSPVLDEIAAEHAGKSVVAKVNVDQDPGLAVRCRVTAIPTVIIFRNGHPVERFQGLQPRRVLTDALAAAESA